MVCVDSIFNTDPKKIAVLSLIKISISFNLKLSQKLSVIFRPRNGVFVKFSNQWL